MTFLIFVAVFVTLACLGVPLLALGLAAVLRSGPRETPGSPGAASGSGARWRRLAEAAGSGALGERALPRQKTSDRPAPPEPGGAGGREMTVGRTSTVDRSPLTVDR